MESAIHAYDGPRLEMGRFERVEVEARLRLGIRRPVSCVYQPIVPGAPLNGPTTLVVIQPP